MSKLFDPITISGLTLRNRIVMSPMCQYSATDGLANDWHLVHLGARATGGAGLILTEDVAILPEGRITPADLGLWSDDQVAPLARITQFAHAQGAAIGVQLGYAGRKGSTTVPWRGGPPRGEGRSLTAAEGAWQTFAPTAEPFGGNRDHVPAEMTLDDIVRVQSAFVNAARRADRAGFDVVELHSGWGYIFHQFYSPLSNKRRDSYGGHFENRVRFTLETIRAIRTVWPAEKPLFLRMALTDWAEGGWSIEDAIELARLAKEAGADIIDGISWAVAPVGNPPFTPLMHVPLIERVRREAGVRGGANFGIETAEQAQSILEAGSADLIVLGRALLNDPHWARHAAETLGDNRLLYPDPYEHWLSGRSSDGASLNGAEAFGPADTA